MIGEHLPRLANVRTILASGSPRRRELLTLQGLSFEVITSRFSEDLPKERYPLAADYASATSLEKVKEVIMSVLR